MHGAIRLPAPEAEGQVAVWVAVHCRPAQFSEVRTRNLSCRANAHVPWRTNPAQAFNPMLDEPTSSGGLTRASGGWQGVRASWPRRIAPVTCLASGFRRD